jgi:integrase/recombinase XerD
MARTLSVTGPKKKYVTTPRPRCSRTEARKLLDSIDASPLIGVRDRALIGVIIYSLARVGATATMRGGRLFPAPEALMAPAP